MTQVEDMLKNMMRSFYSSDEHAKKLTRDFANIGKKVDTYAVSIRHLEL